jgi:hypothetical protein
MKYTVIIGGYGAEVTIGQVDKEQMEHLLEDNGEELSDKVFSLDTPHYEIDDQLHCWGCGIDDATIIVKDENEIEVLNTENGVGMHDDLELYDFKYTELDHDSPLLMTISGEKGTFFEGSFECEHFDINKFKLIIQEEVGINDYYVGDIINGVSYDGEELDNFGGDTTGKSFDVVINFDLSDLRGMTLDDIIE